MLKDIYYMYNIYKIKYQIMSLNNLLQILCHK